MDPGANRWLDSKGDAGTRPEGTEAETIGAAAAPDISAVVAIVLVVGAAQWGQV